MTSRGSALVEFCVIANLFVVMVSLLVIGSYAILARAQLEYRTEQGLYCLAEGASEATCVRQMKRAIASALPFGRVTHAALTRADQHWKVALAWTLSPFTNFDGVRFSVNRTLSARGILNHGDLHW